MRTIVKTLALGLALAASTAEGEPMKAGDRQRLLAHLEMTESWLVTEIDNLSPAQLKFRMTPDSWSIMDVVEHLAVAEPQYWQQLQDSLKAPAGTVKPEATDAGILWYGIDRTNRQRTGEARVPKGRYETVQASLAAPAGLPAPADSREPAGAA